jgi:hypothetical protein
MRALLANGIGASHTTKKKALQALLADVDVLYLARAEPAQPGAGSSGVGAAAAALGIGGAGGKLGFGNFGLKF